MFPAKHRSYPGSAITAITGAGCLMIMALVSWAGGVQPDTIDARLPSTSAKQPGLPGTTTTETLEVDGLMREAMVYVPASLPADTSVPVILLLHGNGGNATITSRIFGLSEEAERRGVIAVYPNGTELPQNAGTNQRNWNGGGPDALTVLPNDVRFITQLLDLLAAKYQIDVSRTFAVGISAGGALTYRLACEATARFAAVAVVAGLMRAPSCEPMSPISLLHIHGTSDPMALYAGMRDARGPVRSVPEIIDFWRTHNGCSSEPTVQMLNPVVEQQMSSPCRSGSEVTLYTIQEGFHCWPGVDYSPPVPACPQGGPHMSFAATPLIVDFLLAHPRVEQ